MQFSLGFVVAPNDVISASLDLFQIQISDRISVRTPQEVLANYKTLGDLIVRNPTTNAIDFVRAGFINVGGDRVRGADINVTLNFKTSVGAFVAKLDGTYLDQYRTRKTDSDPWVERIGQFGDGINLWDLKLRWKHNASITWSQGNWSSTVSQDFKSGYKEEVDGYGSGLILQDKGFQNQVSSYSLINLSATYTGIKNLSLTAGVKNLFDKDPPFTLHNVDNIGGAGWDPRVADPRGRAYTLRANYKFW